MNAQIVFLVGPPRSGTTLLQSMLASTPTVGTLPETHFFEDVLPLLGDVDLSPDTKMPSGAVPAVAGAIGKAGFDFPAESLVVEPENRTIRETFEDLLARHVDQDSSIVIEKTPGHARWIPQIRCIYPEAKFVAILRHPVECVGSMRKQRPVSPDDHRLQYFYTLSFLAQHWEAHCRGIVENQGPHMQVLYYEDLIEEPEIHLRRLCSFLEIDYSPAMLLGFGEVAKRFINLASEPWKEDNTSSVLLDNRFKWRSRLPAGTAWVIEEVAYDTMQELGYERTAKPSCLGRKLACLEERAVKCAIEFGIEGRVRRGLKSYYRVLGKIGDQHGHGGHEHVRQDACPSGQTRAEITKR